ncbi:MAG: hypothetical protein ACK4K0_00415 [Flavobacteriales bacterium]
MNTKTKIKHKLADFHLDQNGILVIHIQKNAFVQTQHIKEMLKIHGELTNGKRCPCVMVLGDYANVSINGRKFLATEDAVQFSLCEAFVVKSLAQKILGNFYLKFDKPNVPSRLFNNFEDAYAWAKTFITKD